MRKLIDVYKGSNSPDYISMVQCLIIVDDPNAVALVLETLSQGSQDDILMAYQVKTEGALFLLTWYYASFIQKCKRFLTTMEVIEIYSEDGYY